MSADKTISRSNETEAVDATPTMEAPLQIPNYRFSNKLGSGAMAIVYKALDTGFNPPFKRWVAIKLMDEAVSRNKFFRVRFEQEAGIVADFDHDNIVRVYTC